MAKRVDIAYVKIWDHLVGAVGWDRELETASFEFDPDFLKNSLDISPIKMPFKTAIAGSRIFSFRSLRRETFYGLPGMLADSLPDKYGNLIIDKWLASQGRQSEDFSPIERLCYMGKRGMGALEFEPVIVGNMGKSVPVEVEELVKLAQMVTNSKRLLETDLHAKPSQAILDILRVGTSAGGARAKAVVAWNRESNKMRSGQVDAPKGFSHWLIKFDGVSDLELGESAGYGRIEYAYYKMAVDAGIEMSESELIEENSRAHFITKRFDRTDGNEKLHMQSLCGIAHYDYNLPGAYSYEQAFEVMRRLRLNYAQACQMFHRMVFNIVARNQDDHTKNIGFLMDKTGKWKLSPAFDVTFSCCPGGKWTNTHQMSANGKRDEFTRRDLLEFAETVDIKKAAEIIDKIVEIVSNWNIYAKQAGLSKQKIRQIAEYHRLL